MTTAKTRNPLQVQGHKERTRDQLRGILLAWLLAQKNMDTKTAYDSEAAFTRALRRLEFNDQVAFVRELQPDSPFHDFYRMMAPSLFDVPGLTRLWPEYPSLLEAARKGVSQLALVA